jgi:transposase
LNEHLNVIVSINTMRHALHEVGLGSLKKRKTPLLTAKNVHCMLEFAQSQDWTIHDWQRVIFSDDTKINQF